MIAKQELLEYEAPWYSEWISWDWLQTVIAKRLAKKINKKYERYLYRLKRNEFFKKSNTHY